MSLLRFAARTMLASHFISQGVKSITSPEEQAEAAQPLAEQAVPLAQRAIPASYAGYIPEETATLVRINGGVQVAGGALFALGLGRRLGASMLVASQIPHVITAALQAKSARGEDAAPARSILLRNAAFLGATILASQDTEGQPSLGWRAEHAGKQISRSAQKQSRKTQRELEKARKNAKKQAKAAKKQAKQVVNR